MFDLRSAYKNKNSMKNEIRTKLMIEHAGNEALLNVMFAGIPAKEIHKGMLFWAGNDKTRVQTPYRVMDVAVINMADPSMQLVIAPSLQYVVIEVSVGWFYAHHVAEWVPNTLGVGMAVATPEGKEATILGIDENRRCFVELTENKLFPYWDEPIPEAALKKVTVWDQLLKRFVGKDHILPYELRSPHKQGDFVYATDRHVMICIPADEAHAMSLNYESDFIESPGGYNFQDCFDRAMSENRIVPEIKMDIGACEMVLEMVPTEPVYAKCEICKGEGTIHCCACGHNAMCGDCKGSGKTTEIVGEEYDFSNNVIDINGARIGPEYAHLLLTVAKITGELIHVAISPKRGGVNVFKSGAITIAIVNTFMQVDSIYQFPPTVPFESTCFEVEQL